MDSKSYDQGIFMEETDSSSFLQGKQAEFAESGERRKEDYPMIGRQDCKSL